MTRYRCRDLDESGPPPTILVVDDQEANLLAAAAVLESLGHPIMTASSGEAALKLVLAHDFVLILMDVHMPDLDGYETASLLRGTSRSRDVPIVFLTAVYDQPEHMRRGYELGAADSSPSHSTPISCAVRSARSSRCTPAGSGPRRSAASRSIGSRISFSGRWDTICAIR